MTARAGKFSQRAAANAKRYASSIKRAFIEQVGVVQIWLVDGKLIRDHVFIDFTEGGNSHAYKWMPPNEIWLDTDVDESERNFVKLHELHEFNRMTGGMGYERAHDSANITEQAARNKPEILPDLWKDEVSRLKASAKRLADLTKP
jgi:hypothetical protein